MDFKEKVVLITGASSGIGAESAVQFAKHGAKLVLGGRNEDNLRRTAAACEEQGVPPTNIELCIGDLTVDENCTAIVDRAIERFNRLDILVNNAGTSSTRRAEKMNVEDADYMYKSIVRPVIIITNHALPHLKQTKGCIVNVSSILSIQPGWGVPYGMAKAALNHYSQALAIELGPSGVRVNCVLPGIINTPLFTREGGVIEGHPEKLPMHLQRTAKLSALKRSGTPEEVAKAILFLSSDNSSFITGSLLPVDGWLKTPVPQ